MLFESALLSLVAGCCGVGMLSLGFKSWTRPAFVGQLAYAVAVWLGLLTLVFVLYTSTLDVVGALGGLADLLTFGSAGGLLLVEWRLSTLLACLVPSVVFGLLLLTKPTAATVRGLLALVLLLGAGLTFVLTNQLFWWLVSFELLLLVSLYLLRLTSKSERIGDAVAEMFFWTLAGSICLLFAFTFLAGNGVTTLDALAAAGGVSPVCGLLLIVGFGVKLPLWPCFSWLLKAHVEASVEFSILLSGVVVKFGALGLYRALLLQGEPAGAYFVLACGTIAIIEATLRVVSQRDLKRIVALTTVIEMNWLAICIGLGGALFDQIGAFLLVAHSLTTAGEFYSVECVYRRFGSRDLGVVSGVAFAAPLLFGCLFLTTLVTIGFPASSLFAAKLLFLTGLAQLSLGLCVFYTFWFVLVLPVAFLRVWLPVWFGQPQAAYRVFDLTGRELSLLSLTLAGGVALGLQPTLVLGF